MLLIVINVILLMESDCFVINAKCQTFIRQLKVYVLVITESLIVMKSAILLNLMEDVAIVTAQDLMKATIVLNKSLLGSQTGLFVKNNAALSIHAGMDILRAMRDVMTETELEGTDAQCIVSMLKKAGNVLS